MPLPDEATRREILQLKFNNMPIHSEVSLDWLVSKTPGYSGAEVRILFYSFPIPAVKCITYYLGISRL